MSPDPTYTITRKGRESIVTRLEGTTFNPASGDNVTNTVVNRVRWTWKEPTSYSRLLRATTTQQRIGETTFVFWLEDIKHDFTELKAEDYIEYDGVRYEVVDSERTEEGLIVTATALARN